MIRSAILTPYNIGNSPLNVSKLSDQNDKQPDTSQFYDKHLLDLYNRFSSLRNMNEVLYIDLGADHPDFKIDWFNNNGL